MLKYRMGGWFSFDSKPGFNSQPLSFNTNMLHTPLLPAKVYNKVNNNNNLNNNNNTRRNRYKFLGAKHKHRTVKNKPNAFAELLRTGVVPERKSPRYIPHSYPNIPGIPNVAITGNKKKHRHEKIKVLFNL